MLSSRLSFVPSRLIFVRSRLGLLVSPPNLPARPNTRPASINNSGCSLCSYLLPVQLMTLTSDCDVEIEHSKSQHSMSCWSCSHQCHGLRIHDELPLKIARSPQQTIPNLVVHFAVVAFSSFCKRTSESFSYLLRCHVDSYTTLISNRAI